MVVARLRHRASCASGRRPGAVRLRAARRGRRRRAVLPPALARPVVARAVAHRRPGAHGTRGRDGAAPLAGLLRGRRPCRSSSACRSPGCWPASPFPGRAVVRALVLLPMVLPPVVGGVALLLAFGRRGLARAVLDAVFGITLPFTTAGAIVAETFVAMPFLVITVEAGLARARTGATRTPRATLGAGRWTDLPARHPAAGRAVARRRRGAVLGARARRVRRHDHLRRQLSRHDPDHAAGGLPGARERPGRGDRAQPRPARRLAGGARRAARPLVPVEAARRHRRP